MSQASRVSMKLVCVVVFCLVNPLTCGGSQFNVKEGLEAAN